MAPITRTVPRAPTIPQQGFTLTELAIVMFIVALLLGGMLMPLSAQQDIRARQVTEKSFSDVRDALLGFAIAKDRLPCPASATSNGQESPVGGGVCTNPYDGYLPAVTLGMSSIDAQGYLSDGWGGDSINRVRYAVSTANANSFSTASGMKTAGIAALAPNLKICGTGVGIINEGTESAACAANTALAIDAVAIVYSLGKNAGVGGTGNDEKHNPNPQSSVTADPAFVNAPPGASFDDQMTWLSKNTLLNRMVAAGKLP
jgi:prepilin-type N-terminal cleavage/methylation domain-containing protein